MEQHKVLQPYKDWLLLNRGDIKLKIGDKIKVLSATGELSYNNATGQVSNLSEPLFHNDVITDIHIRHYNLWIHKWFVEIDYNPNESIEFGQFILDRDKNHFSVQELYNQFKNE